MLDVHAPEHKIGGARDFIIHILTITVGLLIALGLEASVEALHNRHEREEAEATIRAELRDNRDALNKAQADIKLEEKNMVGVLDFLQARLQNKPADPSGLTLGFHEGPLQDSAWRTANSTGILRLMDYAQVQKYSLAYKEQAQFEEMETQALNQYLELDSFVVKGFDPNHVTPDDMKAAIPVVRLALARLVGMQDISHGALMAYDEALK